MDAEKWISALLAALVISSVACLMAGKAKGRNDTQSEAVKAGVAEYYLDANNEKQFRWKSAK